MNTIKKFGKFPDKNRKAYFNTLDNYKNGKFQNQVDTPSLAPDQNMLSVLVEFAKKHKDTAPKNALPSIKTDIQKISIDKNVFIWFGHSSYYIQLDEKRFLIDPVFSGNASPIPNSVVAFKGTNNYQAKDIPTLDYLIISHDHWDHLDFETVQKLKGKVGKVICGLGVAQHFEYWGWAKENIIEKNWNDTIQLDNNYTITLTPARHFSGRLFSRNITLWTSFVLQCPTMKIFLGGDSGFGPHIKTIGEQYGPFDFAILECGQYNEKWPYIHSLPEEIIQEVKLLKAKNFIPVHNSKFKLAQHPWYEPLETITKLAEENNIPISTPKIGEIVDLNNLNKHWPKWWNEYR